jgi:DNA-3-methyladenine glycosylase II
MKGGVTKGGLRPERFAIEPVPPFRLDLTAWALRRRPINAVDCWDGKTYRRALVVGRTPVQVTVTQPGATLEVTVSGEQLTSSVQSAASAALERLLGIHVNLAQFYECAAQNARLNRLVQRFHGLKPPRFPTVFEALVNGITCQQLSLSVGIILLNRLAAHCGRAVGLSARAFPEPEDLAVVQLEELRRLGYSRSKGRAVIELARAVAEERCDLNALAGLDDQEAVARLRELQGIGRWTAEYVLLRGLGRTHVFPGDDVGARKSLERWRHLRTPLDYQRVRRVLKKWEPYGGLLYFHFLLDGLDRAGYLP